MDCSLPGSFFHGVFQARILEWGANIIDYFLHVLRNPNNFKENFKQQQNIQFLFVLFLRTEEGLLSENAEGVFLWAQQEKRQTIWGFIERQFCRSSSLEAASEILYNVQGIFLKSALWKAGKLSRILQWKLCFNGSPVVLQKCLQVGHIG